MAWSLIETRILTLIKNVYVRKIALVAGLKRDEWVVGENVGSEPLWKLVQLSRQMMRRSQTKTKEMELKYFQEVVLFVGWPGF